jgi:hypothetical protein
MSKVDKSEASLRRVLRQSPLFQGLLSPHPPDPCADVNANLPGVVRHGIDRHYPRRKDSARQPQPGSSRQIAEQRETGVFSSRKEPKQMYYGLEDGRVSDFISMTHTIFREKPRQGSNS